MVSLTATRKDREIVEFSSSSVGHTTTVSSRREDGGLKSCPTQVLHRFYLAVHQQMSG